MAYRAIFILPAVQTMLFVIIASSSEAQNPDKNSYRRDSLYQTIKFMDSVFFDAFNRCDVEKSRSMFTEDLEFYHDKGGLTNFSQNLKSILSRCSGTTRIRRELDKESLEVYPIRDYGAIEIGRHRFFSNDGTGEKPEGVFRFVHIWRFENGKWKIARVISYDH